MIWPYSHTPVLCMMCRRSFVGETLLASADSTFIMHSPVLTALEATSSGTASVAASVSIANWVREMAVSRGPAKSAGACVVPLIPIPPYLLDLARDAVGRTRNIREESLFLRGRGSAEQVRGIQISGFFSTLSIWPCTAFQSGRDGERDDPQVTFGATCICFLEPFRERFATSGALGVMSSYNDYDGIPIQGQAHVS